MTRDIVVLGSTGSIGTQALDIVAANPDDFRVVALSSAGSNLDLFAKQIVATRPKLVGVADSTKLTGLLTALQNVVETEAPDFQLPEIVAGNRANDQCASLQCDVVLNGITGSVGLSATIAALQSGTTLALANKESLVVGGSVVTSLAQPGQIVPVDSEHSALAQCLRGGRAVEVHKLILTASGGPFRNYAPEQLARVTVDDALAHPTWDMGPVVTINSATMVNKGLEIIEAHLLFGIDYGRINAVIHPQSIVHSMVEFVDGSTLAQVSPPDMHLPIALGLAWPNRVPGAQPACDWTQSATWEFMPLDTERFPAVRIAREAGESSGTAPAVFNAANEVAVAAFLAGGIAFTSILQIVESVLNTHHQLPASDIGAHVSDGSLTVEAVLAAEQWSRQTATEVLSNV